MLRSSFLSNALAVGYESNTPSFDRSKEIESVVSTGGCVLKTFSTTSLTKNALILDAEEAYNIGNKAKNREFWINSRNSSQFIQTTCGWRIKILITGYHNLLLLYWTYYFTF